MPGAVGYADGTGAAARFSNPSAIVVDPSGNLFVADAGNQTIRKVTSTGVVSTFAGTAGSYGYSDGVGAAARFNTPKGLAIDAAANLYVADNSIRKISPSAVVTTLAGGSYGSRDGQGVAAVFASPHGLSVGPSGVVYVTDQDNYTIRKISPTGFVVTMAGAVHVGGYDNDPGTPPPLTGSRGIAVDFSGAIYVSNSDTIHKITPDGIVRTLTGVKGRAGTGGEDGNGSGGDPGTAALLAPAEDLCVNQQGTVYTGADGNVRQIAPDGTVRNLAGHWRLVGSVDAIGAERSIYFSSGLRGGSHG